MQGCIRHPKAADLPACPSARQFFFSQLKIERARTPPGQHGGNFPPWAVLENKVYYLWSFHYLIQKIFVDQGFRRHCIWHDFINIYFLISLIKILVIPLIKKLPRPLRLPKSAGQKNAGKSIEKKNQSKNICLVIQNSMKTFSR